MAATAGPKSILAAESPPFNPISPAPSSHPHHRSARSRSNSPYPSNNNGSIPNSENSNALPKFTFAYKDETLEIRNVWAENVEEEMAIIREVVQKYPYIAMDTEFPGVVAKPVAEGYSQNYHYKSLKVNVDLLKIIQLGLSFADEYGNFAPGCPCWQFNFEFNLEGDMFAQDSIDLLVRSGISFEDHATRGIDPLKFGELLMVSGLVLDDRVRWVSFHSAYDYGYLLKLLTTSDLPANEKDFFDFLNIYFPTIYDIKYMTSILDGCHFMGGLQRLGDDLGCQRLGVEHQAGSDSLLTMSTYFALVRSKFMNTRGSSSPAPTSGDDKKDASQSISKVNDAKYKNELFGYGNNHTVRRSANNSHHAREMSSGALSNASSDTL